MPKDFIRVDTTLLAATFARDLVFFKDRVREAIDLGEKLKGVMEHNISGGDYADVEARFGLSVGEGQLAYNLVAGTLGALKGAVQSSDALTLIDRIG